MTVIKEQPETSESPPPRSLRWAMFLVDKLEQRAANASDAATNHELISKLTFLMVIALAYESWGDRIITLLAAFV